MSVQRKLLNTLFIVAIMTAAPAYAYEEYATDAYTTNNAPESAATSTPESTSVVEKQSQNAVTFITGGVGDEERDYFKQVRDQYSLHIMNSSKNGEFTGDSTLTIYNREGNAIVTSDIGPLTYVDLPPATYTLTVENNGAVQKKYVKITRKSSNIHFVWN